mmetsp:Transcript_37427/g.107826  ORF Transcript_37427/g.107826 Transcript_37427/m.107826 type:complete len:238 (+) Transcript_37427:118-831(+)
MMFLSDPLGSGPAGLLSEAWPSPPLPSALGAAAWAAGKTSHGFSEAKGAEQPWSSSSYRFRRPGRSPGTSPRRCSAAATVPTPPGPDDDLLVASLGSLATMHSKLSSSCWRSPSESSSQRESETSLCTSSAVWRASPKRVRRSRAADAKATLPCSRGARSKNMLGEKFLRAQRRHASTAGATSQRSAASSVGRRLSAESSSSAEPPSYSACSTDLKAVQSSSSARVLVSFAQEPSRK